MIQNILQTNLIENITATLGAGVFSNMAEIFMAIAAMILLVLAAFLKSEKCKNFESHIITCSILILVAALGICFYFAENSLAEKIFSFNNLMVSDSFVIISKIILLIATICVLFLHLASQDQSCKTFEFPILIIFSVVGMMVMISANDFLTLYMGLELQSLSLYVMAAYDRKNANSSEAGLKYFILGALASGFVLFGVSLVYGFVGSTNFTVIQSHFASNGAPELAVLVGMIFIIVAFCFKISAAPFHMWTPDVYQGSPLIVTSFFAIVPKIAAILTLTKILFGVFDSWVVKWQQIIIFVSIISMIVGSFGAIWQKNIKRLMAYSSIGHVGFATLALASGFVTHINSLVAYLVIYAIMSLGVFTLIHSMRRDGKNFEEIEDLAGVAKTNPLFAISMLIFMFSMAGIPPLSGFFAKYYVMSAAVNESLYFLVVIAAVASVISAFYYLRIVKICYFGENAAQKPLDPVNSKIIKFILFISVIFNLVFFTAQDALLCSALHAQKSFVIEHHLEENGK